MAYLLHMLHNLPRYKSNAEKNWINNRERVVNVRNDLVLSWNVEGENPDKHFSQATIQQSKNFC